MKAMMIVGAAISLAAVVAIPYTGRQVAQAQKLNDIAEQYACPPAPPGPAQCGYQLQGRADRLREIDVSLEASVKRQKALVALIASPAVAQSIGARAELELESKVADGLREERQQLMVAFDLFGPAAALLIGAIVAVVLTSLVLRRVQRLSQSGAPLPSQTKNPPALYAGWWVWCVATVVVVVGTSLFGQYLTAVERDKSWFGFDSWAVSAPTWIWVKVGVLGNQLLAGCAVAVFACVGRPGEVPAVALLKPRAGLGPYVDFIRTWTVLGFVTVLVFGCYWLWIALADPHRNPTEKIAYALPVVGAALPIGVLLRRVVGNMRALHGEYEKKVAQHEDPAGTKPAADPTLSFFEDKLWQLPSTVVALGSAAWLLLDILGVRKSLLGH
jgi:hypothetical protein